MGEDAIKKARHALEESLLQRDAAGGDGIGIDDKRNLDILEEAALAPDSAISKAAVELAEEVLVQWPQIQADSPCTEDALAVRVAAYQTLRATPRSEETGRGTGT